MIRPGLTSNHEFRSYELPTRHERHQRTTKATFKGGYQCRCLDSFIAATARVHNLVVVTRNVADFQNLGVLVVNPWLPTTPSSS